MNDAGFYLYIDYIDKLKRLTDEQVGKLIRALLEYKATGNEPDIDDSAVGIAFDVIRVDIDKQAEKYQKRAEAGRKGGSKQTEVEESIEKQNEANGSNAKQTEANGSNDKQTEAEESNAKHKKENKKENKKEKENEIENTKEKTKKEKTPDAAVAALPVADSVRLRFQAFVNMRKAIKKPMTGNAVDLLYGRLQRLSTDPDTQCAILEQSIRNSWQDVYPLKVDGQARARPENKLDQKLQQIAGW